MLKHGVRIYAVLVLLACCCCCCCPRGASAWWFSGKQDQRGSGEGDEERPLHNALSRPTPFEMETIALPGSERGQRLLDDLKKKLQSSCWNQAYSSLFSSCGEVLKSDEKKMRLSYRFADCFLRSSGKEPLRPCSDAVPVKECTKTLTDHRHHLLLQFFIDVASMCHHLQSEAFKMETEEVVSNLKLSAHWVESKLEAMQRQAGDILQNTDSIIGMQRRLQDEYAAMGDSLAGMQEGLSEGFAHLKQYADDAQQQLHDVSFFQKDLSSQQEILASQHKLLSENLQAQVSSLGDKADSISLNVLKSLTGQEELLVGQDAALAGLSSLKHLQEASIEEGRRSFEEFASEAKANQLQFQRWQEELKQAQQRLADGSASILNAQEVFASKQAMVFSSLDRLFALHNVLLTESRTLKAVFFYVPLILLIYLMTGTKQTSGARAPLYLGACLTFCLEFWLLRSGKLTSFEQYEHVPYTLYIRGSFAALALGYVFLCIFTYRDYASLSYKLLVEMQKQLEEHSSVLSSLYVRTPYHDHDLTPTVAADGRCFESYLDLTAMDDDPLSDPNYEPSEASEEEDGGDDDGTVSSRRTTLPYNLRQNARRRSRPLASSASMLDWETEEMFVSLFVKLDTAV